MQCCKIFLTIDYGKNACQMASDMIDLRRTTR